MAIFKFPSVLPARLVALRQGLLIALLAALYLVLWQGPGTLIGKTFFVGHLGLFMLWQPFVHAEQRLSLKSMLGVVGVVAIASLFLTAWLLSVWIMMLAGIVGGKVLLFGARATRLFFMLALGFLVMALLLMAAPMALPTVRLPEVFARIAYVGLPLMLVVMTFLPQGPEEDASREVVDFVYSLFVFLLLAVLMLGSLAAMMMFGSAYVEALLQSLLLTGMVLLLLGWAWNPHAGFAGLGNLFSRYMMSIGLPVEQWLQALADLALREEDPERFLEDACSTMAKQLPWVTGGEWLAGGRGGRFGVADGLRSEFRQEAMTLVLYTRHSLSPTLVWHFNLLARLLAEFHADKRRALALKQLSYMQAIHETGARLTHDVKNLLQSLNALCSAGIEPGAASSPEYQALLRRQLPAISSRLADTLDKLNAPQETLAVQRVDAAQWWQEFCQRMAAQEWIELEAEESLAGELPAEVFSGVADNLVRNAAEKHLGDPVLRVRVELKRHAAGFELIVSDNGAAMAEGTVSNLFVGPVSSESGYGTGLYHAARYAKAAGYRLELVENRIGRVCFRLVPVP
jgi:signal transduction histidine kinase